MVVSRLREGSKAACQNLFMRPSSRSFYNRSNQSGQQIRSRDRKIVNGAREGIDGQLCLASVSLIEGTRCFDGCVRENELRPLRFEARTLSTGEIE